jgi:hypothetical protein
VIGKALDVIAYYGYWTWLMLLAFASRIIGRNKYKLRHCFLALREAKKIIRSASFQSIPKWETKR